MGGCCDDQQGRTERDDGRPQGAARHGKNADQSGGKRADGAEIVPNDDQKIMDLLKDLWETGDTQKVADGVLGAEFIWGEDLNKISNLNGMVKLFLDLIQDKGMLEAVKTIL